MNYYLDYTFKFCYGFHHFVFVPLFSYRTTSARMLSPKRSRRGDGDEDCTVTPSRRGDGDEDFTVASSRSGNGGEDFTVTIEEIRRQ